MVAHVSLRRWAAVIVLTLLLVIAAGLWWSGSSAGAWFAYAPLSDAVITTPFVMLSTQRVVALFLGLAGLLGLAGMVGFSLGRRR